MQLMNSLFPQQFGGGMNPDGSFSLAGPSGFAGGMFGAPSMMPQQQMKAMGSPFGMLGMMAANNPAHALPMLLGGALGFGLHKLGAF